MKEDGLEKSALSKLLRIAGEDEDILAVILFGSHARVDNTSTSDIDVCLALFHEPRNDSLFLSQKKLQYLKIVQGKLDIQVFQQLPLYIRRRVAKEGKILFVRDEDRLYELASRTSRAFEDFKHRYFAYLEQVAHA